MRVADEARAGVPTPAVVHRQLDQFDVGSAQGLGAGDRSRVDDHLHRFETGNSVGHAGEVLLHLRQGDAPTRLPECLVMGPDHPCRGVPDPLGRHPPAIVSNFIVLHDMLHDKKPC
ncbi:hypothetical protein D3C80_1792500 [compost metagenome]